MCTQFSPLSHFLYWPPRCSVKRSESCSVVSDSLWPHGLCSPWNPPGQNTGVGSRSLLQGIFPTQGSNPGLPHCRWVLHQLSHQGSPDVLSPALTPLFHSAGISLLSWQNLSCFCGSAPLLLSVPTISFSWPRWPPVPVTLCRSPSGISFSSLGHTGSAACKGGLGVRGIVGRVGVQKNKLDVQEARRKTGGVQIVWKTATLLGEGRW